MLFCKLVVLPLAMMFSLVKNFLQLTPMEHVLWKQLSTTTKPTTTSSVAKKVRYLSAYDFYRKARNRELRQKHPDMPFSEIFLSMIEGWKDASAEVKQPYRDKEAFCKAAGDGLRPGTRTSAADVFMHAETKRRPKHVSISYHESEVYDKWKHMTDEEKELYETVAHQMRRAAKRPAAKSEQLHEEPTGAKKQNPYRLFIAARLPAICAENPDMPHTDRFKLCIAEWKALSAEQKAVYEKKALSINTERKKLATAAKVAAAPPNAYKTYLQQNLLKSPKHLTKPEYLVELARRWKASSAGKNGKNAEQDQRVTKVLSNGARMPLVGFGTYVPVVGGGPYDVCSDDKVIEKAVCNALKTGYRHFDCAYMYGNERGIGRAIQKFLNKQNNTDDNVISREDLFISTKIWNTMHRPVCVHKSFEESKTRLQLDYVDLLYIHWPFSFKEGADLFPKQTDGDAAADILTDGHVDYLDTYRAIEELVDDGQVRGIGLSNFNIEQIQRVLEYKSRAIPPVVLQVEVHVYLQQRELVEFCHKNGIAVVAFSPLAAAYREEPNLPRIAQDAVLIEIAKHYGDEVTPQQVALAWLLQRQVGVIPRALSAKHMQSNFDASRLILTDADMKAIAELDQNFRYCGVEECRHLTYYPF